MTGIDMTIKWQRRRAEVEQDACQAIYNKVEAGIHKCHVLGLFQCSDGEDDINPYFICELDDGRTICASPRQVRFLDTAELNAEECDEEAK